ncbi:hypothetical protein LCGC14_1671630, partial [marine sediment metagenome]
PKKFKELFNFSTNEIGLFNFNTDVIEVGEIKAIRPIPISRMAAMELDPTKKYRPAIPGTSIGHYKITAGTFGAVVIDDITLERRILSNNHVLANSNDAEEHDPIYQPGPHDGGDADDLIGFLDRFVPIKFSTDIPTCPIAIGIAKVLNFLSRAVGASHRLKVEKQQETDNYVDAAIARPTTDSLIKPEIMNIGIPQGVRDAQLDDAVRKMGRTTGYTEDTLNIVGLTVQISYGEDKVAIFKNQNGSGPMSAGGDSGSLILDMDNFAVGLLYAGSDQMTIWTPIRLVQQYLKVKLVTA